MRCSEAASSSAYIRMWRTSTVPRTRMHAHALENAAVCTTDCSNTHASTTASAATAKMEPGKHKSHTSSGCVRTVMIHISRCPRVCSLTSYAYACMQFVSDTCVHRSCMCFYLLMKCPYLCTMIVRVHYNMGYVAAAAVAAVPAAVVECAHACIHVNIHAEQSPRFISRDSRARYFRI